MRYRVTLPSQTVAELVVPLPVDIASVRRIFNPRVGFTLEEALLAFCIVKVGELEIPKSRDDLYQPLSLLPTLKDLYSLANVFTLVSQPTQEEQAQVLTRLQWVGDPTPEPTPGLLIEPLPMPTIETAQASE